MSDEQPERMLTVAAVADRIGTPRRTVYRLIEEGKLPAYRFGEKLLRVSETDLEAHLQRSRTVAS
jgi:excisionase family DNA binding protein